ncbi:hypothetical protein [Povalibacter sp.]|uniref:hypothetical protein n=1 Tax=Povalibacter sp. TaxID=1962978 RepID=UPI002F425306
MGPITEFLGHFWGVLILIGLALVLTYVAFKRRWFERGYRKGEAKNPAETRRQNPPDEWSRNH